MEQNFVLWAAEIIKLLKSKKYQLRRDGWSILKMEYFIEAGFPQGFIRTLVESHRVNTGPFVEKVDGIFYLDFLRGLKKLFNVEVEGKLGRGSEAGVIIKAIHEKLGIDHDA